jgi:hypothetical protein
MTTLVLRNFQHLGIASEEMGQPRSRVTDTHVGSTAGLPFSDMRFRVVTL